MPMRDTDIVARLRWQKRYTSGIVPVTMEDGAKEIERLRAALLKVRAEINLSKAPKLAAAIDEALGPYAPTQ